MYRYHPFNKHKQNKLPYEYDPYSDWSEESGEFNNISNSFYKSQHNSWVQPGPSKPKPEAKRNKNSGMPIKFKPSTVDDDEDDYYEEIRNEDGTRIIKRDYLLRLPENRESSSYYEDPRQNSNISSNRDMYDPGYDWTLNKWRKQADNKSTSHASKKSVLDNKNILKRFDRTTIEALSQPVTTTKAESMMQKMGWKGGALGKTGEGITEPIIPITVYSSRTIGFGQEHKEKPVRNRMTRGQKKKLSRQEKKEKKECLKTNVLLLLLDFIKDDNEAEMIFDGSLTNFERKMAHNIIAKVFGRESNILDFDNIRQMDLEAEIHSYNCERYTVTSESFGKHPNRQLHIYKEGTEYVYLITPDDLKDQVDEDYEEENEEEIITKNKANKSQIDKKKSGKSSNIKGQCEEKECKENADNIVKGTNDGNLSKEISKEIIEVAINTAESTVQNCASNIMNKSDLDLKQCSNIESTIKGKESTNTSSNNINKGEIGTLSTAIESIAIQDKQSALNNEEIENKIIEYSKANNCTDETDDVIIIDDDTSDKIDIEDTSSKLKGHQNEIVTKDLKENGKKGLTVIERLIEYLIEFALEDTYIEFRFAGPFDIATKKIINNFLRNVAKLITNPDNVTDFYEEYGGADLIDAMNGDDFWFNYKYEDDRIIIYKGMKCDLT